MSRVISCVFFSLLTVLVFNSCTKIPDSFSDETPMYVGNVVVDGDNEEFVDKNVRVKIEKNSDGKLDIVLYAVKFASAMPIRLDVTIEGISIVSESETSISFAGNNIVPYALGGPYEKFMVTNLSGSYTKESTLTFSLNFGKYPTSYSGFYLQK